MFVFCFFFSNDIRSVDFAQGKMSLIEEMDDLELQDKDVLEEEIKSCVGRSLLSSAAVRLETVVCISGYCVEVSLILEATQMMESKLFWCIPPSIMGTTFFLFWKFPSSTNPTS